MVSPIEHNFTPILTDVRPLSANCSIIECPLPGIEFDRAEVGFVSIAVSHPFALTLCFRPCEDIWLIARKVSFAAESTLTGVIKRLPQLVAAELPFKAPYLIFRVNVTLWV